MSDCYSVNKGFTGLIVVIDTRWNRVLHFKSDDLIWCWL